MGAISSCCAVEESPDRQVVQDSVNGGAAGSSSGALNGGGGGSTAGGTKKQKPAAGGSSSSPRPSRSKGATRAPTTSGREKVDETALKAFEDSMASGINVFVLLQDGTKLACIFTLNPADESFSISCEDKVRVIPVSDIKSLLSTKEQLKRVETKADLVDDPNCVALHLSETGNCIPLRFDSLDQKNLFIHFVKKMLKSSKLPDG